MSGASGGLLVRRPGTLSADGHLLFAPCGSIVRVFSALTGENVGSLEGHTAEVMCVLLNPSDTSQVGDAS